jgi:hypothetical protein
MNLIERYVAEVGRHLPPKGRADIQSELRSTLEDMLDDRSRKSGKPVDEAMTIAVLKEYGAPEKVAASYAGPRYLIGPKLFPIFSLVTQIVITVLFAVSLGAFALSVAKGGASGEAFITALGQFFLQFFSGAISAFGNIVIVFAILERVIPAAEIEKQEKEWDPAQLAKEPDPDLVKPAELIFGILFTVAALVVINLYPDLIGFGFMTGGKWAFIPVLSEAFYRYLPAINILGFLRIAFSLWQIRQGTWNLGTRIADILIEIGGIALAVAMLAGPSLMTLTAESLTGTPLAGLNEALSIFRLTPYIVLGIVIIVSTIEVAGTAVRLVTRSLKK